MIERHVVQISVQFEYLLRLRPRRRRYLHGMYKLQSQANATNANCHVRSARALKFKAAIKIPGRWGGVAVLVTRKCFLTNTATHHFFFGKKEIHLEENKIIWTCKDMWPIGERAGKPHVPAVEIRSLDWPRWKALIESCTFANFTFVTARRPL